MTRALVLLAAFVFFRTFLAPKKRSSPTEISPYMNSLDGLISAQRETGLTRSHLDVRSLRAACYAACRFPQEFL